jgi:hypothetical protein
VPTTLTGGIGNNTGNGSASDTDSSCSAEFTGISQSGANSNTAIQIGNLGFAACGNTGTQIGPSICPVVNGSVDQSQEQNAGHNADAYTGGSSKKGKSKKKKKNKKH